VGKIIEFRRRRWTRPRDYGAPEPKLRFWPERKRKTLRGLLRDTWRWLGILRPFILLAILVSLYVGTGDPALVEPPGFLASEPEQVAETFTRCGLGRGHACVIDGDTFKIGERKVRIIGIDAPETHPSRCAEEARLGEAATAKLQELLNQGAFEMVAPVYRSHDMYGRDLRAIRRRLPDGSYESIASEMRESGLAHRYLGGLKVGWC
jgi:endonuclease YncB( thermonuclease family)